MSEQGNEDGHTGANRLQASTSPYLRQHAENPVDWYPWGPEALDRAVREERPILLSVGYSACHWCHVMAHESFEDATTAREMNEWFVNIKVDREERPDVDAVYQRVVALMGQGGGWPLTVFLTPDQRPFYGGTYFPPRPSHGRPSFRQVLAALHDAWENRREEIDDQAGQFMDGFAELAGLVERRSEATDGLPSLESEPARRHASGRLLERIDPRWGGLGGAPKFPNVPALGLLLERAKAELSSESGSSPAADAVELTLERMWRGGIYDHLRGGFARYSVDREWLVPHFEKMLYDNAMLLGLYADASVLWPERSFLREVVTQTVEYLVTDMRAPEGMFFSATDADSEGVEGKYFCWTPSQLREALDDPDLADLVCMAYDVTGRGNFEDGMSILHRPRPWSELARRVGLSESQLEDRLAGARARLLEARYRRVPPLRDEKMLTAWNALLVSGLCRASSAARAWGELGAARSWATLARDTAQAVWSSQVSADGSVMRVAWEGGAHTRGYLDDVAALARACLDVHEITAEAEWIARAEQLSRHALSRYAREGGGFWFTAADAEMLVERTESQHDSPMPSGLATMIETLARLESMGRAPSGASDAVEATLARFRIASTEPFAYAGLLAAAAWAGPGAVGITLRGDVDALEPLWTAALTERVRLPRPVSITFESGPQTPEAVVCRGRTCTLPLHAPDELRARMSAPEL